jgi:phytanoyl-CoA dioxygenase PhyH
MRQIFRDDTLQRAFLEPGYVKVPMLSPPEVAAIRAALAQMRPHDAFAPQGPRTFHCSYLDDNEDYRRSVFRLLQAAFAPSIGKYLKNYIALNCNFYVKPPGAGEFLLHQNWPALPLDDTSVTIWCPLLDTDAANGTLEFVVGSHKIVPHVEGPNVPGLFDRIRRQVIEKYLTPVPVNAGEAIIFDDSLIHWSARNTAPEPRVAIQILCVPADAQPCFYFYDPGHPERFEQIRVDSEFFLKVRPRELCVRDPAWVSLGFVPNRNVFPDEAEFLALLARGPETRRRIYAGETSRDETVAEDAPSAVR